MKERPILFSAPMVRAIREGRKTMTRRVVKGRALDWLDEVGFTPDFVASKDNAMCPYGKPGDRLWVRETWQGPLYDEPLTDEDDIYTPAFCVYKADGVPKPEFINSDDEMVCRWRPSIHMPRWASRITLEIVSVRVERLRDISMDDVFAEGCMLSTSKDEPRDFQNLWESISGAGSWAANPWVWVVEFKRAD
jgi:hypothetical protein